MRHAGTTTDARISTALLLAVALACQGCAMLDTVSTIEPAPTTYVSGSATDVARPLKIEELNAGLLPHVLGTDNARRALHIALRYLPEPRPDIVVLLEVFDENARAILVRELRKHYPWIVTRAGGASVLPEDSGMLIASRLPIVKNGKPHVRFKPFNARGPMTRSDFWATKGVVGAELDLGGGRSLCVLAAHLMADYEVMGQYAAVRAKQLREVREFGRAFLAEVPSARKSTTILVGDLNVPAEISAPNEFGLAARLRETEEYRRLMEILVSPRDLYRESNPDKAGHTWNHDPYAPGADPALGPWRLDYALLLDGLTPTDRRSEAPAVKVRAFAMQPGITDHRGLQIEIGPRAPIAAPETIAAAPVAPPPAAPIAAPVTTFVATSLRAPAAAPAAVAPVAPAPAPARDLSDRGGISAEGLRSFLESEARRRGRAARAAPRGLALGARIAGHRAVPRTLDDLDPLTESMGRLPEGHEWPQEQFVPSGGSVDLVPLGGGTISGRAWEKDEAFRGVGVGYRTSLGGGWQAAAEVGVDPFGDLGAGGMAVVIGVGRRL